MEIDTAADPAYNSTGLIGVHKAGVESVIGPSDSAAIREEPLAVGVAWREGNNWKPLASLDSSRITSVKFQLLRARPKEIEFSVRYEIRSNAVTSVLETYKVRPEMIAVHAEVGGATPGLQVRFPAFVFDGKDTTDINIHESQASVSLNDSRQTFTIESPLKGSISRTGKWIRCRNGFLQAITAEVPGRSVTYTLKPEKVSNPGSKQPGHR